MVTLVLKGPFAQGEPTLVVENDLPAGKHRFRLVVTNNDGVQSDPDEIVVAVRERLTPGPQPPRPPT